MAETILIVDDEKSILDLLHLNFTKHGYEALVASHGREALELARSHHVDLVVLDLMMPGMDGVEVLKELKDHRKTKNIPVLMLTAKKEEDDRVVGFEQGADDYVTKPFSPKELLLRVKAILRRTQTEGVKAEPVKFGDLWIDPAKPEVMWKGSPIILTSLELKLVQFLLAHKGVAQSREMLLGKVWGYESQMTTRTVDTHVKRLRQKLGPAGDYIETVRGTGYRFKEQP